MALGPVMLDLDSTALTPVERELLAHPNVGGVVLFARNYAEPRQLAALVDSIHAVRTPHLLVAVDQEGGRVQRFREGFTRLPPMAALGTLHDRDPAGAEEAAQELGWLLAAELRAVGVDISFAPVLDLRRDISRVIGDRALHPAPDVVVALGAALMEGMGEAGMAAVGKHFPGHGSVAPDSHHELPLDERSRADILQLDGLPFERLAHKGLPGIMPAHVVYPQVDSRPAGLSRVWIQEILRDLFGFTGAVFSDDLSMAAVTDRPPAERAQEALDAGCDMVLVCNDRPAAETVVESIGVQDRPLAQARLIRLHGRALDPAVRHLERHPRARAARALAARLGGGGAV